MNIIHLKAVQQIIAINACLDTYCKYDGNNLPKVF